MGILPMSRRVIPSAEARYRLGPAICRHPRSETPVGLTGRMPVLLLAYRHIITLLWLKSISLLFSRHKFFFSSMAIVPACGDQWIPAPRFRGDKFTPAKAGAAMTITFRSQSRGHCGGAYKAPSIIVSTCMNHSKIYKIAGSVFTVSCCAGGDKTFF